MTSLLNLHLCNPPPNGNFINLPVLQKASDGYKLWHNCLEGFPKSLKYSLGQKTDILLTDVIELILTAGFAAKSNKLAIIQKASIKLDAVKFFLQIAWELKAIDNKKFSAISAPLVEVGKMLGGWQKQIIKETPPNSGGG
jgi:hypothetical protein